MPSASDELLRLETFLAPQVESLKSLGLSLSLCVHTGLSMFTLAPEPALYPSAHRPQAGPDTHRSVSSSFSRGSVGRWPRQAGVNLGFVFPCFYSLY